MKRAYIYLFILLIFLGIFGITKVFPLKYYPEISKLSKEYQVDESTIYSIVKIESNFRETVISHKGAMGLMQIIPSTGEWMANSESLPFSEELLLDPSYNLRIGTLYLSYLTKRYNSDAKKMLIAYNAGPTRLSDGSWENFKETKNYIVKYEIVHFFYTIRLSIRSLFL